VSLFFGLFGLIPAVRHSRMARERGYSERGYWWAFGVVVGIEALVAVVLPLVLATALTASVNNLNSSLNTASNANPTSGNSSSGQSSSGATQTSPISTWSQPTTPFPGATSAAGSIPADAVSTLVCPTASFCAASTSSTTSSGSNSNNNRVFRYECG